MFGPPPTWWCPGPQVRHLLAGSGARLDLAADAPPAVMDAAYAAYAAVFGDAAVYCQPAQVRDVVTGLHADPAAFVEQSRRAVVWATRTHQQRVYVDYVTSVLAHRGGPEEDPR
jgi:hypothetical protein